MPPSLSGRGGVGERGNRTLLQHTWSKSMDPNLEAEAPSVTVW